LAQLGSGLAPPQTIRRGAVFAASAAAGASARPSFSAESAAATDANADIVFKNGPVYTVDSGNPWARAVAVKGKRIVFVGDDARVEPFVGPQTRVVDLAGKMLLPGFVEGHIHPLVGATLTRGADLQFDTREDILGALKAYREKVRKADLIRGFGWRYSAFPSTGPRKEDLDAFSWIPERSATRLREADMDIFSKLGKQGLEWRLKPEAFAGREVGRQDDLLDVLVGCAVDIEVARQPST
jgi:hypothetical protein